MSHAWQLSTADFAVIGLYLLLSLLIGLYYSRKASLNVSEFFLSGRELPWWLVGTSMVATTFAADTPLAVAGLVASHGVAGNWVWWNFATGNVLTVVFFARLWRRVGVVTDVQLCEVRYGGSAARALRGFRALWLGLIVNAMIIGWVNLAMAKILAMVVGWDRLTAVLVCFAITGVYSCFSGLWGVVVTDAFQFLLAMATCFALAFYALALPSVGGMSGLHATLPEKAFSLLPAWSESHADGSTFSVVGLTVTAFLAHVGIQWWSAWYPGSEPGGGGYIAQRMMSARDERHATLATLWFTIAHYCLRPWPWIIVGLVALKLYPSLADKESGYVLVMQQALPAGWRGLMLGGFLAAYMSTISTQLNWGASYIVNDFYQRFVHRTASASHYVWISRLATLLVLLAGGAVTFVLDSVAGAWQILLETGAGLGFVLILRWYWWRINAWSEIVATLAPVAGFFLLRVFHPLVFPQSLFALTAWTVIATLLATFLMPSESEYVLFAFYAKVKPPGPGWRTIARRAHLPPPRPIGRDLLTWLAGTMLIYGVLLGTGELVVGSASKIWLPMAAALAGAVSLCFLLSTSKALSDG